MIDVEGGQPFPAAEPAPPADVPVDDDPPGVRVRLAADDQPAPAQVDRDQRILHRVAGRLPVAGDRGREDQQRAAPLGGPGVEVRRRRRPTSSHRGARSTRRARSPTPAPRRLSTAGTRRTRSVSLHRCGDAPGRRTHAGHSPPTRHRTLSTNPQRSMLVARSVDNLTDLLLPALEGLTLGRIASIFGVCPRRLSTRFVLTRAVQRARRKLHHPLADPRKDPSWPPRAPPRRTKSYPPPAGSPSRRSPNPWKSQICWICRSTPSTGSSATRRGGTASRPRWTQGRTDINTKSGLEEIFEEISPIEDFSGTMSLSFRDHRFEPPKNTVEECKERDVTYAAPLFVTAEFMNNETGEIKSQTVFMGDFPLMTDKGTFVINGTERVVVSQLVRSPGRLLRADHRQDLGQGHLHLQDDPEPRRVAGVRDRQAGHGRGPAGPQAQAERHRAAQGAGLGRRQDPGGVRRLRVDAADPGEGPHHHPGRGAARHLPQAAARASRRPARPRRRCWRTTTSTPSATTWPRSAGTRSTRSWAWSCPSTGRC